MDLNWSAFQEPRGVMKIFQFIFSICAFASVTGYSGILTVKCRAPKIETFRYPFDFHFYFNDSGCSINISSASQSDATFFVTTGVLTMLYALLIIAVYAKFEEKYRSNTKLPVTDFLLTVVFAVLWLSSSAAWANGLSGLKESTNPHLPDDCKTCTVSSGNFTSLTISVLLGFLNFFLWATNLWFVYKETSWFQEQNRAANGV